MSIGNFELCQEYRGRAVLIRTHNGEVHKGIIHRVTVILVKPFH